MTHRNRTMDQYRVAELREVFIEMFCTVRTAVDNPMMHPSGSSGRRAFLVLDEGELEGNFGYYWAEDEEDGAEGFLDALVEDVFWIWKKRKRTTRSKVFQISKQRKRTRKEKREKVILQEMRAFRLKTNGKEMRRRIGVKAIGPMKMKQRGNPNPGMNGKKITVMSMDTSKEKGRKERKEKEKERKVMESWTSTRSRKRTKWWERRSKLCEPITFLSIQLAAGSSTFVIECLRFLCDTFFYVLNTSWDHGGWRSTEGAWVFRLRIPWAGARFCYEGRRGRHGFPCGESDATHSSNPRSWLHKSYGLQECYQRILWIRGQAQLWTMVQDWTNELKIFLCEFSTNQVHWEVGHSDVWQGMERANYWVWHCWRRKCSIVDVISSDEKSWFSIWALTTAVIPESCQTRNVETQALDVKEHSFSHGLPRHCLVHECSLFQDTWGTEFLFWMWTLWVQPVICWGFSFCYWGWLGNWLPQEGIDPSPQGLS